MEPASLYIREPPLDVLCLIGSRIFEESKRSLSLSRGAEAVVCGAGGHSDVLSLATIEDQLGKNPMELVPEFGVALRVIHVGTSISKRLVLLSFCHAVEVALCVLTFFVSNPMPRALSAAIL